ncbi:hypothetical protein [Carnobacterium maltaromaticum]|uniref:hypothetical protein n=1 Tax=Carnobacterium maltaromaticum TaxID=2751 RepID=UPI0039BE997C
MTLENGRLVDLSCEGGTNDNLLKIVVKDIDSLPEIYYEGKRLKGLVEVEYLWKTRTDVAGVHKFNIDYMPKGEKSCGVIMEDRSRQGQNKVIIKGCENDA